MNKLQLALLILGILIILGVIINALRERRRDSIGGARWTPPSRSSGGSGGKGLPLGDQMDIFGSAAGEFDEFGVGRPRKVKEGDGAEAALPTAAPDSRPPPPPPKRAQSPAQAPAAAAGAASVSDHSLAGKARKVPTLSADREGWPATDRAAPSLGSGLLRTPSSNPQDAMDAPPELAPAEAAPAEPAAATQSTAASEAAPDCVVVLFVAEREGRSLPGTRIHAALRAQKLVPTPEKIYQRGSGDDVSFSIASLVKPGALDPADAGRFAAPGLTLYLTVPGPQDPVAALEDLFITSDRLAGALDADVFDQARQPLTAASRAALRQKVAAAAQAA